MTDLKVRLRYHVGQLCVDHPGASGTMLEAATHIETLERTIEEMRANQWQPIETAPNDRSVLVTFNPDDIAPGYKTSPGIMVAYWDAYYSSGGDGYTGHSGWVDAYSGEECYLHHGDPTHWMPLPEPPALRSKGE